jgi:hypothetical protein
VIPNNLYSKILAFQNLAMLSDDVCKVIERESEEYTWKDMNGLNEEMGGMTITALTLQCLQPHHKVDMYSKIGAVKKMTLAQYDNDINLFFDSTKTVKHQIDSKNPMVYTDNAFVFVIFLSNSRMNCF